MGSLCAMDLLVLHKAPPLDPAWLAYEEEAGLPTPRPPPVAPLLRQPLYAAECRVLHAQMMAPGARDSHLSGGVTVSSLTAPSSKDAFAIPVIRYDLVDRPGGGGGSGGSGGGDQEIIVIYYHGGGLFVGEADSEELSCRRILKESDFPNRPSTLYSVGYRLMPQYPAITCVSDSVDAFNHVRSLHPGARLIIVGSSSGGQLAALVSQTAPKGSIHGVVLRCPVTTDAFNGTDYVPEKLRPMHTSAWDNSFKTSLLGIMKRRLPRDGLERMPLETPENELEGLPRHWIQACTNDMLYSDAVCYAKALENARVGVKVDVVTGWPHTFWLKAPQLPRALEADRAMLRGLAWLAEPVETREAAAGLLGGGG